MNYINDWSPDGRFVMFTRISAATLHDLWLLPIDGERTPKQFLKTQYSESHGQFSPDGKWIAYTSNESGRSEIYVQPLSTGVSTPVSSSGGGLPRWRRDGKELFYRGVDGRLMAVSVRAVPTGLEFGVPTALFPIVEPVGFFAYPYDVTPDGQRILALRPSGGEQDTRPLTVLVKLGSWSEKVTW